MNYMRIPVALALSLNNPCALGAAIALRAVAANVGPLPDDIEKCKDLLTGAYGRHLAEHWEAVRATFEARGGKLYDDWLEDDRVTYERLRESGRAARARQLAKTHPRAGNGVTPGVTPRVTPGVEGGVTPGSGPVRSGPVRSYPVPTSPEPPNPPADAGPADKPPGVKPERKPRKEAQGEHPEAMRHWEREWERTRGVPWAWQTPDAVAVAAALKLAGKTHNGHALEETQSRMTRILEDPDAWTSQNASPRVLRSHWHKFGHKIVPKPKTALQATLDGLEAMFDKRGGLPAIGGAA